MKRYFAAAALIFFAAQATAAPLGQEIARLIDASPAVRNAFWGIDIVELGSGKTLYAHNAERMFIPASNTKLFTVALALDRLGPDFRFQTRVLAETTPDAEGRIHGAVRLVGGGDPNLSARAVPYRTGPVTGNPLAAIEELADQVVARGVKRIDGDIMGDDTWYVWEPYPDGWVIDDTRYEYGAPVSALTVNDNIITLTVLPGARVGDLAEVSSSPVLEYYNLDNRVRTVGVRGPLKIQLDRQPGGRQVRLWGTIPASFPGETVELAVDDPAEFAARALRRALEVRGVAVGGEVGALHRYPNDENAKPTPEGIELARHESAPLIEDLTITAKVSQNLHAELALRAVARARRSVGSRQTGLDEMKSFLKELGIGQEAYSFNDGSGLDRTDLVTPEAIIKLLGHMYASKAREQFIALLPIGGLDGTLSERFPNSAATRRIHAKTGTLTHVSALSGYVERRDGTWVAFSILVNNHNRAAAEVRSVIDRICTLIVE
ncbi:MAG TPA: D-alanyl-D-alanine carboxypeptidase/D-alanyl-D-alanine-endopeptidase [Bryobacteraceae bacterium]|jgi:D-alanyl-D-alanine carboxypeptidase/D-alanyl-D-alanine-endopeptidase (penicillin-binding protein 4)|nr:D-alanyl-D-alanine carboxypeptidase/D-alanyl-D-alanine-endopeptidase [Bryobacteraceae bacterium]